MQNCLNSQSVKIWAAVFAKVSLGLADLEPQNSTSSAFSRKFCRPQPPARTSSAKGLASTLPTLNLRRCFTTLASGAVAFDEAHPIRPCGRGLYRGARSTQRAKYGKMINVQEKKLNLTDLTGRKMRKMRMSGSSHRNFRSEHP